MKSLFKRCFTVSFGIHAVILILLVAAPLYWAWRHKEKQPAPPPPRPYPTIEVITIPSEPPQAAATEPATKPDILPTPKPPKTTNTTARPAPTALPKTKPGKPKPEIGKGPLVQRPGPTPLPGPTPVPQPTLTAEQIGMALTAGLAPIANGEGATGDEWDAYFGSVHEVLYENWIQPSGMADDANNTVEAVLRVESSGRVTGRSISKPSGKAALDASVTAAMDAVDTLAALPQPASAGSMDITIVFQLEAN